MDADRIEMKVLPAEGGGGVLAWAPDLPGRMSDGDSPEEADRRCREAIHEWLDHARREGMVILSAGDSLAVA